MLEKSYHILELPAVLEMLAAQAESELGKDAARSLQPSANTEEVRRRLQETTDAARLMTLRGSPSFSGAKDIRPALERARLGGALNTKELREIAGLARCARLARHTLRKTRVRRPVLTVFFMRCGPTSIWKSGFSPQFRQRMRSPTVPRRIWRISAGR